MTRSVSNAIHQAPLVLLAFMAAILAVLRLDAVYAIASALALFALVRDVRNVRRQRQWAADLHRFASFLAETATSPEEAKLAADCLRVAEDYLVLRQAEDRDVRNIDKEGPS